MQTQSFRSIWRVSVWEACFPPPPRPHPTHRVLLGAVLLSQGGPDPYPAGNERVARGELLRSAPAGRSSGSRSGRGAVGGVHGPKLVRGPSKGTSCSCSDLGNRMDVPSGLSRSEQAGSLFPCSDRSANMACRPKEARPGAQRCLQPHQCPTHLCQNRVGVAMLAAGKVHLEDKGSVTG